MFADVLHGVCACEQTLCGGFFVAGRTVDLSGEEEALDGFGFEAGFEVARVEIVVFDGVAWAQDYGRFQGLSCCGRGRFGCRTAGWWRYRLGSIRAWSGLGLEENLVAVFVGEAVDFVFDGRAVARTSPSILPVNMGAAVET